MSADVPIRAGNDDDVAIGIAQPRLTVLRVGVDQRPFENCGARSANARHRYVEPVMLEPQCQPVAGRFQFGAAEMGVLMKVPAMKLQHHPAVCRP
ncbi:MAG: hypothetical protein ABI589_08580 [Burkholderiales bacterium]